MEQKPEDKQEETVVLPTWVRLLIGFIVRVCFFAAPMFLFTIGSLHGWPHFGLSLAYGFLMVNIANIKDTLVNLSKQ